MNEAEAHRYTSFLALTRKPTLGTCLRSLGKRLGVVIGAPVTGLVVSGVLQALAWQYPGWRLRRPWLWLLLGLGCSLVLVVSHWVVLYRRYSTRLEGIHTALRSVILTAAGIDYRACDNPRYHVVGITDRGRTGTLHLVLDISDSPGLSIGSMLDVVATRIDEVWGTVRVIESSERKLWAVPTDRRRPEFFEKLEDQMRHNPLPPKGVHLEPYMPPVLRHILSLAMSERKRHDI